MVKTLAESSAKKASVKKAKPQSSTKPSAKHKTGSSKTTNHKHKTDRNQAEATAESTSGGGFDEIESLFAQKKQQQKEEAAAAAASNKNGKHKKKNRPQQNRTAASFNSEDSWVDDGLGGKYNKEGYTGRVEDGMKIFKTHLLQSDKSGSTPQCPFDCDCCYI